MARQVLHAKSFHCILVIALMGLSSVLQGCSRGPHEHSTIGEHGKGSKDDGKGSKDDGNGSRHVVIIIVRNHTHPMSMCWNETTNESDVVECEDGALVTDWKCAANGHGDRTKCPPNYPWMCLNKTCGDGQDYCCSDHGCVGDGLGVRQCPVPECWNETSNESDVVECEDGSLVRDWKCAANGHGGRSKCPPNLPWMCASKTCGDGQDNCCSAFECQGEAGGVLRECEATEPTPEPAPTLMPTSVRILTPAPPTFAPTIPPQNQSS